MNYKKLFRRVIFVALCMPALVHSEVVVIVNPQNSMESISAKDLGRIFLGKRNTFPDGGKVTPYNQVYSSSARSGFDTTLLKKSETQIKAYWGRRLFSGEGEPPAELNDDSAVIQQVAGDKTAIGYIDKSSAIGSVKVLSIQ